MRCGCDHTARRGEVRFIAAPGTATVRVRLPKGRYFQFWNALGTVVRMTVEYGGETCQLPTVAANGTSPTYLNPFDEDGFIAFQISGAGAGIRGWLIVSGD